MITQYVSRTKIGRIREILLTGVAISLFIILGLTRTHWQPFLANISAPTLGWLSGISSGISSLGQTASNLKSLPQKADTLERENLELKHQLQQMAIIQQENQRLKQLLAISIPDNYHPVSARVIARSPDHWFAHLKLDVGMRKGVQPNQAVINQRGLVGKVIEASTETAVIQLVSDSQSAVACLTVEGRHPGVLAGMYGESGRLKYLQNYAQVESGEKVFTSGLGGVFPRGLLIGTVTRVQKTNNQPVPEVQVDLVALNQSVEEVLVLVPQN